MLKEDMFILVTSVLMLIFRYFDQTFAIFGKLFRLHFNLTIR